MGIVNNGRNSRKTVIYLMVLNDLLHVFLKISFAPAAACRIWNASALAPMGKSGVPRERFPDRFGWDRSTCVRAAAQVCRAYSWHSGRGIQKRGAIEEVLQ